MNEDKFNEGRKQSKIQIGKIEWKACRENGFNLHGNELKRT